MKSVLVLLCCSFVSIIAHAESRTFTKVDANHASVKIVTDEADGTQAASYVDAAENKQFIAMLLADSTSNLSKIKYDLETAHCDAHSTPDDSWNPTCGGVELTDYVLTSFGRGGWMEAGAGYTFFVGFRDDGTGHFFNSEYMVVIGEDATANTNESGEYAGSVTKTLSLSTITKLP